MHNMTDWKKVWHFTPDEFGPEPDKLDNRLIYTLDSMRHNEDIRRREAGKNGIIVTINESYAPRPKNPLSQHPLGYAADGVIRDAVTKEPLDVFEQFLIASEYLFTGIGLYPFWNTAGIHFDTRKQDVYQPRATWWRDEDGIYRSIDQYFERRFGSWVFGDG